MINIRKTTTQELKNTGKIYVWTIEIVDGVKTHLTKNALIEHKRQVDLALSESNVVLKEEYDSNIIYAIKGDSIHTLKRIKDCYSWIDFYNSDFIVPVEYKTFNEALEAAEGFIVEEFHCEKSFKEWANQKII